MENLWRFWAANAGQQQTEPVADALLYPNTWSWERDRDWGLDWKGTILFAKLDVAKSLNVT